MSVTRSSNANLGLSLAAWSESRGELEHALYELGYSVQDVAERLAATGDCAVGLELAHLRGLMAAVEQAYLRATACLPVGGRAS